MIKFSLKCARGHAFESWFRHGAAFDALEAAGQLSCPHCGDADISKALMAPQVTTARAAQAASETVAAPAPPAAGPSGPPPAPANKTYMTTPDAIRREIETRLRALRAHVEASAEHVGDRFAAEARRIHDGDAESRAIYGEATPEEVEALEEDGVPCAPIPWIDRRDD